VAKGKTRSKIGFACPGCGNSHYGMKKGEFTNHLRKLGKYTKTEMKAIVAQFYGRPGKSEQGT